MRRIAATVLAACVLGATAAIAGPIATIKSLTPRYGSDVIEIEWETSLTGGCTTSPLAVTNATAQNREELTAFLLAAFASGSQVEVFFGGGCDSGSNWIQTIKLLK
jgi:hypothetical protein